MCAILVTNSGIAREASVVLQSQTQVEVPGTRRQKSRFTPHQGSTAVRFAGGRPVPQAPPRGSNNAPAAPLTPAPPLKGPTMRAAVLGSGPAGFYAAKALLRRFPSASVDIIERLPVPFGLVRYGVAPDHPSTKNVISTFTAFMDANPQVRFLGNVPALQAPGLSLSDFDQMYDLTVNATGAARPRTLPNVPLPPTGAYSANDFIFWLNGHPEVHANKRIATDMRCLLSDAFDATVIGLGNVAVDVARLILRPIDDLRSTDISPVALDALAASRIERVTITGRRSPRFASWTAAAIREVVAKISGITTTCDHSLLLADAAMSGVSRATKRTLKILLDNSSDTAVTDGIHTRSSKAEAPSRGNTGRELHLDFLREPAGIARKGNVTEITYLETEMHSSEKTQVSYTGRKVVKDTDILFLSLGYQGGSGSGVRVGWAHGQGQGIIGAAKLDADTVVAQLPTLTSSSLNNASTSVDDWAANADCEIVNWDGWKRIDAEERARAVAFGGGRDRVKLESVAEMLQVARGRTPVARIPLSHATAGTH